MNNYYLLELDDMVIELNNKDSIIDDLKKLLKECQVMIFDNCFALEKSETAKAIKLINKISDVLKE